MIDQEKLFHDLNADGLEKVRRKLAQGVYGQPKIPSVKLWIKEQEERVSARTWMYHEFEAPKGRIFEARDVSRLEKSGWVDTPAKFGIGWYSKSRRAMAAGRAFWFSHWKWLIGAVAVPIIIAITI